MANSGHLFIVNGDLTRLSCDAVLVPTDVCLSIQSEWGPLLGWPADQEGERPKPPDGWGEGDTLTFKLTERSSDTPSVWPTNIASDKQRHDAVTRFLDLATKELTGYLDRPRLALPVVGTKGGGAEWHKGDVLDWLIPMLMDHVESNNVDVVLVTFGWTYYSAAQRIRQRIVTEERSRLHAEWNFGSSTGRLHDDADRLAEYARSGHLVPFIGAGVGPGHDALGWRGLLRFLYEELDHDDDGWATIETIPDLRDQAEVIERAYCRAGKSLADAVARRLTLPRHSVSHGLLAGLRSSEAVTTNYDELYEKAVTGAGDDLAILPYESIDSTGSGRWLLKLHGCVTHPEEIVSTRGDYLGMPARSGALFGITQAMLITRHMMFVGYSLEDESFHKVVHEVRQASRGGRSHQLGTAIFLDSKPHMNELFDDLNVVSMDADGDQTLGARRVELFLDLLAFLSADLSQFLLDPAYEEMLDDGEREVAAALRSAEDCLNDSPVADQVRQMMQRFGSNR